MNWRFGDLGARELFFIFLLVALPVSADGWFDSLRLEIRLKHSDTEEVRGLLSTLVPDAHYEVAGNVIVARGSSQALAQEMVTELDRPLDEVFLDLRVLELSKEGYEYIFAGLRPEYFSRRSRYGQRESSAVWFGKLDNYNSAHPIPYTFFQVRNGETIPKQLIRLKLGKDSNFALPDEAAAHVFGVKSLKLKLKFGSVSESRLSVRLKFQGSGKQWSGSTSLLDGDTLILGEPTGRWVIFMTPSLMR